MSVVNAIPLIAAGDDGYSISRSLRFRSSASAYLNRTFGAGSQTTWTFSAWVKLGTLGTDRTLLSCGSGVTDSVIYFQGSTNQILINLDNVTYRRTTQVFRDPSAWYHIVVVLNTSNATSQNRLRLYINGAEVTDWALNSTVALNATPSFNSAIAHNISRYIAGSSIYFDGYLAEVNFIDGQALAPTAFGTFNSYGVWQPITYGGSYGTNGFRLPFTNNASTTTLGYDFSPQGNNWTTNGISVTAGVTYDSMTDVPTLTSATAANFAVWNPLSANQMGGGSSSVTNGNLTVGDAATSNGVAAQGTIAVTSGKWYWEVTATTVGGSYGGCGIRLSTLNGTDGAGYFYYSDGTKTTGIYSSGSAYGASYTSGDVLGVALDMDSGTITFYKNNATQGTAYTGLSGSFNACVGDGQNSTQYVWNANFGQRPFTYTPPSGYLALNTFNL